MKRVELTTEQLDEVVRLRQSGMSFNKIEQVMKGNGVTRRIAKRAYDEWEQARSVRELESVRVKAGEIEFESHVNTLTHLAVQLAEHLAFTEYPELNSDAQTYLDTLMDRQIDDLTEYISEYASEERKRERIRRQNRLLLESLKAHTADTVDWTLMETWMEGRDACRQAFPDFADLIAKTVHETLTPFPDPDLWIIGVITKEKILKILESEIIHVIWKGIASGHIDAAHAMVVAQNAGQDGANRPRVIVGGHTFIQDTGDELNPAFFDLCRDIVSHIWNSEETKAMLAGAEKMRQAIAEFDEKLEPLVLRPQLLRTRCRICPA